MSRPSHAHIAGKPRHLHGWIPSRPSLKYAAFVPKGDVALVPPAATVRVDCLPPVNDQGELGDCVGNATCEAIEFVERLLGLPIVLRSRLFPYYFVRELEGTPPTVDSGCQISDMMTTVEAYGAPPESDWPYDISKFADTPPNAVIAEALKYLVTGALQVADLAGLKASIAEGYPVVFGIPVPAEMTTVEVAATGLLPIPDATTTFVGGHCMLAYAYDDTKRLVVVRNSWSASWGSGGDALIPYDYWERALASDMWTARSEMV